MRSVAKLPYGGLNRIRFEGSVSTTPRIGAVPPLRGELDHIAPAAAGRFDNILANPVEQTVRLPQPVRGRYVKFVSLSAADGKPYCAMAGLEVLV